ncbi:MAG: radical SAM protein [Candidatus Gastranaerophilaceae bacterium]
MIEPTNICNLKCIGCVHDQKYFKKRECGIMSFKNFKKILDLNLSIKHINLWGMGEPFINKEIFKFIDYASSKSIFVSIHTNGILLDKKLLKNFFKVKNLQCTITFSIDGLVQKTYESYRRGGNFEIAFGNMKELITLKKEYKKFYPRIVWQYLITKKNQHEISRVKKIAKLTGVDKLRFKIVNIQGIMNKDEFFPVFNEKLSGELEDMRKTNFFNTIEKGVCGYMEPSGGCFILWNGAIVPCCVDHEGGNIFGNAFKESYDKICAKEKCRNFIRNYFLGKNNLCNKYCRFKREMDNYEKIY